VNANRSFGLGVLGKALSLLAYANPTFAGNLIFTLMQRPRRKFLLSQKERQTLQDAQRFELRYNGQRLQGYAWGQGPAVLLMHGWEAGAGRFGVLIRVLLAQGYRVVAYDAPAHGASQGRSLNLLQNAEGLGQALAQLGPVYAVIGHSFGGASALWWLGEQPSGVQKAVILAAPENAGLVVRIFADAVGLQPQAIEAFRAAFRRRMGSIPEYFSLAERIQNLSIPGLVIHDHQDQVVSFAGGRRIAAAWETSSFLPTTGLGHSGVLEDEGVLKAIVDFLR